MASEARRKHIVAYVVMNKHKQKVLRPRLKVVRAKFAEDLDLDWCLHEVYLLRQLITKICCPVKRCYSTEDRFQATNSALQPYLCHNCGWIHYGHPPKDLDSLERRLRERINYLSSPC